MTLEDLFKKLSYGELSNLSAAVDATGTIKKEQQNRVVAFADEGLKRLHSRFPLLEETGDAMLTGVAQDIDLSDDVLLVRSIFTSWGQSLTIETNPIPDTFYVHNRKLHIPALPAGTASVAIQVTFQKRHPELTPILTPGDLAQEISLMEELHEALTAYIAQKMYGASPSPDMQGLAQAHRQRYEQVCTEAMNQGLFSGDLLPIKKLETRGFV